MPDFFDQKFKNFTLASIAALTFFLFAAGFSMMIGHDNSKQPPRPPSIIVGRGEASVSATPNTARFNFTARAEDKSPKIAQQKMMETANKALGILENQGIKKEDITTENYSTFPNYDYQAQSCANGYCPPSKRVLRNYEAVETFSVKISDFTKAGDILSLIAEAGVAEVSDLSFEVDNLETLRNKARKEAIIRAKEDAKNTAEALGVRLGEIVGFNDNSFGAWPIHHSNQRMMAMSVDAAAAPIEAGQSKISSSVNISYEIR